MNLFKYFMVFGVLWSAPTLADTAPVAWWTFDKSGPDIALDRAGHVTDTIEGHYTQVAGVKGTALKLDGYTTCLFWNIKRFDHQRLTRLLHSRQRQV